MSNTESRSSIPGESKSGGNNESPVYFWREFPEEPYDFMSQWYSSPFEVDGVLYATAEMWMMVQKAKLFGDQATAEKMIETTDPAEHQRLGRTAAGFNKQIWNQNKSRIVEEGNYHKFKVSRESREMQRKLLDTGDRELVEASPSDRVWGIGFAAEHADRARDEWGENLLGKALMKVRDQLKAERGT